MSIKTLIMSLALGATSLVAVGSASADTYRGEAPKEIRTEQRSERGEARTERREERTDRREERTREAIERREMQERRLHERARLEHLRLERLEHAKRGC